ncbi:hypothetical protein BDV18DRAFT_157592 [Aspergillus unguis]
MSPRAPPRQLLPKASSDPRALTRPLTKTRVTKATAACTECRKRRSKCDTGIPCSACRRNGTNCTVDWGQDRRRKRVMRQKIEALGEKRDLLLGLIENIRDSDKAKVDQLRNFIKGDIELDDLRQFLGSGSSSRCEPAPDVADLTAQTSPPIYQVPAQPWTQVTDDEQFISHLISVFLTWIHPISNWLEPDLFFRDMQSGGRSRFCSPALVNSVLAMSSSYVYSPRSGHATNPNSRTMQFYTEAKDLLDQETGQVTLPSVQARCALYLCTYGMGKEMLGWHYLVEITTIVRELIARREIIIKRAGEAAHEMARALDRTISGSFCLAPFSWTTSQKQTLMPQPKLAHFPEDHETNAWWPYPLKLEPVPAHVNCLTNALLDLQFIEWDIASCSAAGIQTTDQEDANAIHNRLKDWARHLPGCISVQSSSPPAILDLHTRYNIAILAAFGRIDANKSQPSPASAQSDRASEVCRFSAEEICRLTNSYHSRWPIDSLPVTYIHYITLALLALVDLVPDARSTEPFMDLEMALRALGRRWPMAKANLRLIQMRTETEKPAQPLEPLEPLGQLPG